MSIEEQSFTAELGYGKSCQSVTFPQKQLLSVLQPNQMEYDISGVDEVERSLDQPIGSLPLEVLAQGKHKVAIVTSDITRPMPSKLVLPSVLRQLYKAGVDKKEITIVIALGSHRPQTKEEMMQMLGEDIVESIPCVNSCECDFLTLGTTAGGTPIELAKPVVEADLLICLGNIEYHYFAGYSGGAKAIMPGVSTRKAIQANHSRMVEPEAHAGRLVGNPVREDIEEAASACGIPVIPMRDKEILLQGYDHGFFGGCGGVCENEILLCGTPDPAEYAAPIHSLTHFGKSVLPLYDGPLYDCGGIKFFPLKNHTL